MFEGFKVKLGHLLWRAKRFLRNVAYRLRVMRLPPISVMKPSLTVILALMIAFVTFILAGGIYDLMEKPVSLLPRPSQLNGWTFIYPGSINVQTLNESLVSAVLYLIGLGALYLLLKSTRSAYRPRNAYLMLILGFITTLVVVYYANFLLGEKVR
jgi:hypothetical protein